MSVEELAEEAGGFSRPSKPACLNYSLPTSKCKAGSKLHKQAGTTCSGCYARKGMYVMPNVEKAMSRRYKLLQKALKGNGNEWVDSLAAGINQQYFNTMRRYPYPKLDGRFFRWHDSGDLQSTRHLHLIYRVVEKTPKVLHFLPTRETEIVATYISGGGKIPHNLKIRLSAPKVNLPPTPDQVLVAKMRHSISLTTVHTDLPPRTYGKLRFFVCPATTGKQKTCTGCRVCWVTNSNITFKKH
jgi:hypothetical protein